MNGLNECIMAIYTTWMLLRLLLVFDHLPTGYNISLQLFTIERRQRTESAIRGNVVGWKHLKHHK